MPFCIVCSLRGFRPSQLLNSEQQHPFPSNLARELEGMHKFSFNSILTLLAALAISGSKALLPAILALLIYTISLRLAVPTCFFQTYPTLSRFLHAIPLLATSCMAGVQLVFDMHSPALAVIVLLLSILPLVTNVVHHGRHCAELETMVLPIRMRDPPATDTTAYQTDSTSSQGT